MNKVLAEPRAVMSPWAPSIITLKIDPEKIRDVIGKGGAVIRQITEETGTTIDIENDGTVKIASVNGTAGREAQRRIELITADVEVGRVYEGRVVKLMDFGAFVEILPGRDGLVHISSPASASSASAKAREGDQIRVKSGVDRQVASAVDARRRRRLGRTGRRNTPILLHQAGSLPAVAAWACGRSAPTDCQRS
jgi:polyribonucleotide nucleotidyltransferase